MAGTGHGTAAAASTAGGFALPPVLAQLTDDSGNDADQDESNGDRARVIHDAPDHRLTLSGSASWLPDTS